MAWADVPMLFILAGLVFYVVLGGADYGAALWQVTAGRGPRAERLRELAHDSMAPVWEANHVWLIFVLTVLWTAYPPAFGAIASTLAVALTLALLGIIVRGAAYALRSGTSSPRELKTVDMASAVASVIAPFALGAAAGAIASGRVPPGNAAGDLWASWLAPTPIAVGIIAVLLSAYMAAVFLAADAQRVDDAELADAFRGRALLAAAVAGAAAAAGLVVLHADAHELYRRLLTGPGLPAVLASAAAGGVTVLLLLARRHEAARVTAGLAVAAVLVGWALAQQPQLLPGLTVHGAAAPRATQVAVTVAIVGGGLILFPSLTLLFRLTLAGHLREGTAVDDDQAPARSPTGRLVRASRSQLRLRLAAALLLVGFALVNVAEADWAHVVGGLCFVGGIATGAVALAPLVAGAEFVPQGARHPGRKDEGA